MINNMVPYVNVARILKPLVGKSIHHVKNTQDFIDSIKGIHMGEDQCMMSYDVKALFTSVPTTKVLHHHQTEVGRRSRIESENLIVHR